MGARALMAVIAKLECQDLGWEERREGITTDAPFAIGTISKLWIVNLVLEVCLERRAYAFHAMPH